MFVFFQFLSFLVSEGDFHAMITFFCPYRWHLVANVGFSALFVGCSDRISPDEFRTFEKSLFFNKKCKRHFPWRIPILPIPNYSMSLEQAQKNRKFSNDSKLIKNIKATCSVSTNMDFWSSKNYIKKNVIQIENNMFEKCKK